MPQSPGKITDEQGNYLRFQLIIMLIEKTFRKLFHNFYEKEPTGLCSQLKTKKNEIDMLLKKKSISEEEYNILLPKNNAFVKSDNFDTSFLKKLLLNLCGYKVGSDKAKAIRYCIVMRNKIQHWPTEIPVKDKDIDDMICNIKNHLLVLGASKDEINELKNKQIADKEVKKQIKKLEESSSKFYYEYKTPIENFFNRVKELKTLHQLMQDSFDETDYQNNKLGVVVHGMGGVGKSQLCLLYTSPSPRDS